MLTAVAPHYPIALVTTRSRAHIEAFLAEFEEITAVFSTTIGAQDTRRLKPHPAPIQLAAQRLGIPPANCLMIGDTRMDVLAARRAGALSVGVLCGFGQRHELERGWRTRHLVANGRFTHPPPTAKLIILKGTITVVICSRMQLVQPFRSRPRGIHLQTPV